MKCLLCVYENNQKQNLTEHYIKEHNIDQNNLIFKKLINQKNNLIFGRNCNLCNEFVYSNKPAHDFLRHYAWVCVVEKQCSTAHKKTDLILIKIANQYKRDEETL